MKTLLTDRTPDTALLLPPAVTLMADSAVTPDSKPLFLPDFNPEWLAEIHVSVRISRLGKNIAAKFAPRYYDAVTIALRLIPVTLREELDDARCSRGLLGIFDNAVSLGSWLPLDSVPDGPLTVAANNFTQTINDLREAANNTIEALSRYMTLKTGDIISPYRLTPTILIEQGSAVNASIAGIPCLSTRIK